MIMAETARTSRALGSFSMVLLLASIGAMFFLPTLRKLK
jgi:hypothetical protein